jgi:hypothetical protein
MSCETCCCKTKALYVAGFVFLLIALVHIIRIFHPFALAVDGHVVPHEASIVGAIIFGLLSLWMFCSGCRGCKCGSDMSCKK